MSYLDTRGGYLNCNKRIFNNGVGRFDVPNIRPCNIDVSDAVVIGFNYALTEKNPEDKIVHFFLDDYQFERVWCNPDRYINLLKRFRAVIAPDFSLYTNFPRAVQIFNHYRQHWCAAYWQEAGINVIANPQWCLDDPSCFDWCLDGEPHESLICVSTTGGFRSNLKKQLWLEGWNRIMEELQPSEILLFGKKFPEIEYNGGNIIVAKNLNLEKKRALAKKR